jgi:hypothetical protein
MSTATYANSAFEAANSAGSYANSAFITANTANTAINTKTTINALNFLSSPSSNTQNTIFLVVDLEAGTPTTRKMSLSVLSERSANFAFQAANSAGSYANAAFSAANSASGAAAAGSYANSAFETANSSASYANSAFLHANSAFLAANSAGGAAAASSYANSAFETANSSGSYANSAFIHANAAFSAANSAGGAAAASSYANSAFETANSSASYANSAFETANSSASYANSAFGAANAAIATDATQNNSITASFIHANSGFNFANVSANLAISFGATTILEVTNNGAAAYRFSQYGVLDNPNVSTFSATTLGFKLNVSGHPFHIRLGDNSNDFDTGLVHVSPTGTLSYDSAAQGQVDGTLFWRIPSTSVGNYKYRCSIHTAAMIGEINVANTAGIYFAYNS